MATGTPYSRSTPQSTPQGTRWQVFSGVLAEHHSCLTKISQNGTSSTSSRFSSFYRRGSSTEQLDLFWLFIQFIQHVNKWTWNILNIRVFGRYSCLYSNLSSLPRQRILHYSPPGFFNFYNICPLSKTLDSVIKGLIKCCRHRTKQYGGRRLQVILTTLATC